MSNKSTNRLIHACAHMILIYIIIILMILFVDIFVYISGGTEYTLTHLMYIPIILAAFLFGIKGSVGAAILGGISLGPFMPLDVSKDLMQTSGAWILRLAIYIVIGLTVGLFFQRVKKDKELQLEASLINEMTGLPNSKKMKLDLTELIKRKKDFSLMVFRIVNLDHINIYVDYDIGEKSIFIALEILKNLIDQKIYSIYTNEFAVAIEGCNIDDAYLKARQFLNFFEEPIHVLELPVSLDIHCGIIHYPLHGNETNDLFKKMGRTLDQEEFGKEKIVIYEDSISQKNKAKYETVISLYEAIKENKFTMVYQPIIDVNKRELRGVEALLRWTNQNIRTGEFIKIAEDAGIISEITKLVIKNVIDQLIKWQDMGIEIKISVNISSDDLKDDSFIQYVTETIKNSKIHPTSLVFELTERIIVENENEVEALLNRIKKSGIKISLDDFGTGYNSLIQLIKLPVDNLKIDKYFIDHINKPLIEEMIHLAHNLGIKVIVEGVETEEQFKLLECLGCDYIQGYYFSKPLPPVEFEEYYHSLETENT